MTALVLHIARPVTVWALHFIAIYALVSAACAPRRLLDADTLPLAAGTVTLIAVLFLVIWLVTGLRRLRQSDVGRPDRLLATAAFWVAAISLLAVLANLWPIFGLTGCTG